MIERHGLGSLDWWHMDMTATPRSFLASHREASQLVQRAKKFSVRIPLVGKVSVPPPDQLAFYAGLGILTALNLIDWPVALAIGVGEAVATRHINRWQPARPDEATSPASEARTPAPVSERTTEALPSKKVAPKARV